MTDPKSPDSDVRDHYAGLTQEYVDQYDPAKLEDYHEYPAAYFRLEILKRRLAAGGAKRILDAGVGAGLPAVTLARHLDTRDIVAFDLTPEMVEVAQANFAHAGLDPERVLLGDLGSAETIARAAADGPFDAVLLLGIMPHVVDDLAVLRNIRGCLKPGGRAYASFRNKLFSMFTANRYSHDFVLEELLPDIPENMRQAVSQELQGRLAMDKPPLRIKNPAGGIGFDLIRSNMHNPMEADALFREAGFASTSLEWYHYHPVPPMLEGEAISAADFRRAAMALEGEQSGWRGLFLCSAYLVEAVA